MSGGSRCRGGGFTVLEVIVTLAIVAILLAIVAQVHLEYIRFDRAATKSLFRHPQLSAVTARVRNDVLSTAAYPIEFRDWEQSSQTLIVRLDGSPPRTAVWEFSEGSATRHLFEPGEQVSVWRAGGVPLFTVSAVELDQDRRVATRLVATAENGKVIFDGIFQPRIR